MSILDSLFNYVGQLRYNTTPPATTAGQLVEWQADSNGRLLVNTDQPNTTWSLPGAPKAESIVKASTGKLYRIWGLNTGASTKWIFVFNSATRPSDTSTAEVLPPIPVAAGSIFEVDFTLRPLAMSAGVYWGASSTGGSFTYDAAATLAIATEYS